MLRGPEAVAAVVKAKSRRRCMTGSEAGGMSIIGVVKKVVELGLENRTVLAVEAEN